MSSHSVPARVYSKLGVTVEWRPELCTHCERCYKGLPSVFNPENRPWVNLSGATVKEIKDQVFMCPSGALSLGTN